MAWGWGWKVVCVSVLKEGLCIGPCLPQSGQAWGRKSSPAPETNGKLQVQEAPTGGSLSAPATPPRAAASFLCLLEGGDVPCFASVTPVQAQHLTPGNNYSITASSYGWLTLRSGYCRKHFT